jgi:large subunit ribosomal protein L36e
MVAQTGIAAGREKGFPTTKRAARAKPSQMKGRLSKRTSMVRDLISEVVGMSPYERRMLDMLKTGGTGCEKRMYKFAKRRLGGHKRATKKREQVKETYSNMRAKGLA